MENKKDINKNSNSNKSWVIIGILVIAAIIITVITTNLSSPRISDPSTDMEGIDSQDPIGIDPIEHEIIPGEESFEDGEAELNWVDEEDTSKGVIPSKEEIDQFYIDLERSCIEHGGDYIRRNRCEIDGEIYSNFDWL